MALFEDLTINLLNKWIKWRSKKRLPTVDGEETVNGLIAKVRIIRDQWGVPHIYAENDQDLIFAQGYVHAQDRLWQMEINRRVARGQLSEIAGDITLDTDRATRTLGFERLAKEDQKSHEEAIKEQFSHYILGINTYIEKHRKKLPIEFSLLNFEPEPWSEIDIFAFARLISWQLSYAWYGEIINALLIEKVGLDRVAQLGLKYPKENPTIIKDLEDDGLIQALLGPFLRPIGGSNSWVLTGKKTQSEYPILCNDPHLLLQQPCIWYENHLIGKKLHVTGVSIPGMPLVIIGHNRDVCWGLTLAYTDIQDVYEEKFPQEDVYLYKGEHKQADIFMESIPIRGKKDHVEKVVCTHHGPVISDITGVENRKLTLCSKALGKLGILKGWNRLNQAACWEDFVKATNGIGAPALNITYADRHGNIGYCVTGEVPIRQSGLHDTPMKGWSGSNEWTGSIPFEEMPRVFNPENEYVICCNNKIVSDHYPYELGESWMNGYRANRSESMICSFKKIGLEELKKMQMDTYCIPAMQFKMFYQGLQFQDSLTNQALNCLMEWDGQMDVESSASTIYEMTKYYLFKAIISKHFDSESLSAIRGASFNFHLIALTELYGYDTVSILNMLNDEDNWWIAEVGGREKVLRESFEKAVSYLQKNVGKNISDWQWGKIHRLTFHHALGSHPVLGKIFNQGPIPISGNTDTLFQSAPLADDPWGDMLVGPTYRQIIDTGDWEQAISVMPPGQSGNIASGYYNDQLDLWIKGKYHPMLWSTEAVKKYAKHHLELLPNIWAFDILDRNNLLYSRPFQQLNDINDDKSRLHRFFNLLRKGGICLH